MSNDPTTTPTGEADMPKTTRSRSGGRSGAAAGDQYAGMMGDGTEEQNLNQAGDPSARITEDEVREAFAQAPQEPRSFSGGQSGEDATGMESGIGEAANSVQGVRKAATERLSGLTERFGTVRTQVRERVSQSSEAARDWASKQADGVKQLQADKPVLVLSVSAGAALAVGLLAGFVIGRATADEY